MSKPSKTKKATKRAGIQSTPNVSSKEQKKETRPEGRPTKYEQRYCAEIIEHAKKLGGTYQSFAVLIGVDKDTIQEWAKVHPEFSLSKRRAGQIQEQVMLNLGMSGMLGKNGSGAWQAAWIFTMKARFGWREDAAQEEDDSDVEFQFE